MILCGGRILRYSIQSPVKYGKTCDWERCGAALDDIILENRN